MLPLTTDKHKDRQILQLIDSTGPCGCWWVLVLILMSTGQFWYGNDDLIGNKTFKNSKFGGSNVQTGSLFQTRLVEVLQNTILTKFKSIILRIKRVKQQIVIHKTIHIVLFFQYQGNLNYDHFQTRQCFLLLSKSG